MNISSIIDSHGRRVDRQLTNKAGSILGSRAPAPGATLVFRPPSLEEGAGSRLLGLRASAACRPFTNDATGVRLRIRRACGVRHTDCSTISQRRAPQMTLCHLTQIYGPHQMGNEDQGWVAHFLIRALRGS
jgi:hypothetical protein